MKYVMEKITKNLSCKVLTKTWRSYLARSYRQQRKIGKDRDTDEAVIGAQATAAWGYGVAAATRSYSDQIISLGSYHKKFKKGFLSPFEVLIRMFHQQNEVAYEEI